MSVTCQLVVARVSVGSLHMAKGGQHVVIAGQHPKILAGVEAAVDGDHLVGDVSIGQYR